MNVSVPTSVPIGLLSVPSDENYVLEASAGCTAQWILGQIAHRFQRSVPTSVPNVYAVQNPQRDAWDAWDSCLHPTRTHEPKKASIQHLLHYIEPQGRKVPSQASQASLSDSRTTP